MAAMIPIGIADVSQFRLATGRAGSLLIPSDRLID
jgi:hypothetical protein